LTAAATGIRTTTASRGSPTAVPANLGALPARRGAASAGRLPAGCGTLRTGRGGAAAVGFVISSAHDVGIVCASRHEARQHDHGQGTPESSLVSHHDHPVSAQGRSDASASQNLAMIPTSTPGRSHQGENTRSSLPSRTRS